MVILQDHILCFRWELCMFGANIAVLFLLDVTRVLSELELTIERVKVMTNPDGRVLDLFFITDNL